MPSIVVSEYALPRPRRRPMWPRSTPSSHCSPSVSNVGPTLRQLGEVVSALAHRREPRERPRRGSCVDFCQTGLRRRRVPRTAAPGRLAAAARRRRRRRPGTTSSGRRRSPGYRVLRQFAMTHLATTRGNWSPGGQRGDRIVRNGGVRGGPLGSDRRRKILAKALLEPRKPRTTRMPEEGLEPPTRGL